MNDIREGIVNLWARIINREITQLNFYYYKKAWKDMDVIGIRPGSTILSLYNVKANLNTTDSYTPEKIAENFIDTVNLLNSAYNVELDYNFYLIFEFAKRLQAKTLNSCKSYEEYIEGTKDKMKNYRENIIKELNLNKIKKFKLEIRVLKSCVDDILRVITKSPANSPAKEKVKCFKFDNDSYVYPFTKIKELKFLEIVRGYFEI